MAAMVEGVPVALRPPLEFALVKAVEAIPRVDALAGGCVYEMKWDGFFHWTLSTAHVAEYRFLDIL